MSHSIHHVPGRIRLRVPGLKKNEREAQAIETFLATTKGVSDISVNTVTGSITINYDTALTDASSITDALRERGYLRHAHTVTSDLMPQSTATKAGEAFGKAVFGVLVEKALERSALALIAALV